MPQLQRSLLSLALLVPVLANGAVSQRTWIVDDDRTPRDFADITPAVRAASAGDTILVRPGDYGQVWVDKGVKILGGPGVTVNGALVSVIEIFNVPAGATVLIRGLKVGAGSFGQRPIWIHDNKGHVHVEDLSSPFKIVSERNQQLSLYRAKTIGSPAFAVIDSRVTAVDCRFEGLPVVFIYRHVGALIDRSDVSIANCTVVGGSDGFNTTGPGPGIDLRSGVLRLLGSDTSVEVGSGAGSGLRASAIQTAGGAIRLDSGVVLKSERGAAKISGNAKVVTGRLPSIRAKVDRGQLHGTLFAQSGATALQYVGLTRSPVFSSMFGDLWIGDIFVLAGIGHVPATGESAVRVSLPPLGAGSLVTMQGLVLTGQGVSFTNPAVLTID